MSVPKLSLLVFEAFERVAQFGSMQLAAQQMGISISAVSHHVSRLEDELGVILLDRSTRPFALTREGRETLHHVALGLQHLRRATSETVIAGLLGARSLRIGLVEDFESNLGPELARILSGRMPTAKLSFSNVLSHEAPALLRRGDLDITIVAGMDLQATEFQIHSLLRDPFVIVYPAGWLTTAHELLNGKTDLPFLRFNPTHQIGKQVEAHLARNRISLVEKYNFDTVQSIMAVVANGRGWGIITPLGYARAERFAPQVRLQPLPFSSFSRRISLVARNDFDRPTATAIAGLVRGTIPSVVVDPVTSAHPWLAESFGVLDDNC
jgi:DNA-binding transcriptional LysR family regulator